MTKDAIRMARFKALKFINEVDAIRNCEEFQGYPEDFETFVNVADVRRVIVELEQSLKELRRS